MRDSLICPSLLGTVAAPSRSTGDRVLHLVRRPVDSAFALATLPRMAEQYIFTMHRMRKSYGPDRTVLEDISLAFFPGAKIGVLGLNGAGKSTLLRIMAGVETPSNGEAILAPGATVGLLSQEPELDPAK